MSGRAHEPYEVADRLLHRIAIVMVLILVAIVLTMYLLLRTWLGQAHTAHAAVLPPAPRLQPDPATDLAAERARESALLDGYAWTARDGGFARIPVDRAMHLLLQPTTGPADSAGPQRKVR